MVISKRRGAGNPRLGDMQHLSLAGLRALPGLRAAETARVEAVAATARAEAALAAAEAATAKWARRAKLALGKVAATARR